MNRRHRNWPYDVAGRPCLRSNESNLSWSFQAIVVSRCTYRSVCPFDKTSMGGNTTVVDSNFVLCNIPHYSRTDSSSTKQLRNATKMLGQNYFGDSIIPSGAFK